MKVSKIIGFILVMPIIGILLVTTILMSLFIGIIGFPFYIGITLWHGESVIDFYKFLFTEFALFPLELLRK